MLWKFKMSQNDQVSAKKAKKLWKNSENSIFDAILGLFCFCHFILPVFLSDVEQKTKDYKTSMEQDMVKKIDYKTGLGDMAGLMVTTEQSLRHLNTGLLKQGSVPVDNRQFRMAANFSK